MIKNKKYYKNNREKIDYIPVEINNKSYNLLYKIFKFTDYYYMTKLVFDQLGYDYYKGLKNKLPPIRYIGKNAFNDELVKFVYPHDFLSQKKIFEEKFNIVTSKTDSQYVTINEKKTEIYEIYPSKQDIKITPNGFIALIVDEQKKDELLDNFKPNEEIHKLEFIPITKNGININTINASNVLKTFTDKFNTFDTLINACNKQYLLIGELKTFDIITGITEPNQEFNIIGGKRNFEETTIQGTLREIKEELGVNDDSDIYRFIEQNIDKTQYVFNSDTFTTYCLIYSSNI